MHQPMNQAQYQQLQMMQRGQAGNMNLAQNEIARKAMQNNGRQV